MHLKLEIRGCTTLDLIDGLKEALRKAKVEIVLSTGTNTGTQTYMKPIKQVYPGFEYDIVLEIGNKKK